MKRVFLVLLVLVALGVAVFSSPLVLSDIREEPLGEPAAAQALLEDAWRAHGGLERWRGHTRIELELDGEVPFWPAQVAFGAPSPQVRARLSYDPSRWGEGRLWIEEDGQLQEQTLEAEGGKRLLADSIRHLVEMSFSMESADVLHALPDRDGQRRLFASWGQAAPQREIDQYILWFDPSDGLLRRFDSTGRAIAPFIRAEVTFHDYQDVGGFWLPGRVEVRRPGEAGALVHAWTLRSAALIP